MHDRKPIEIIRKAALIILIAVSAVLLLLLIDNPTRTIDFLLQLATNNPIATALLVLLLYAFKSLTVFFPIIAIEIATGHLFSPFIAIIVNLIGNAISIFLPYNIGRLVGTSIVDKLEVKYPKFKDIISHQKENKMFLCFLVRIVSILPGDLVSMYFGATGMPLYEFMFGGLLGMFPSMFLATLMGESIKDPSSPLFYISTGLSILLSTVSVIGYHLYQRKHANKDK